MRTRRRIVALALCGAAASLGFRVCAGVAGLVNRNIYIQYTSTPARLEGLLLGAALAIMVRSRYRLVILQWAPRVLTVLLLFWVGVMLVLKGPLPVVGSQWMGTIGGSLLSVTGASLVASALRSGGVSTAVLSTPLLRFFGRYSYGLYIYHYSLHKLLDQRVWLWVAARSGSKVLPIVVSGSVQLCSSISLAVLSFHLFEARILRLKSRFAAHGGAPKLHRLVEEVTNA